MQCPKTRWRSCAACQQRIQEQELEDEYELQSWFIRRINRFLSGQGKQLIGWDEILEGGLAEGACVMSWRVRTASQGCVCVCVCAPWAMLCCERRWKEKARKDDGERWAGITTQRRVSEIGGNTTLLGGAREAHGEFKLLFWL